MIAYWEQRGTGKSAGSTVRIESLTLEQYASDVCEVAQYVSSRMSRPKILLLGHSWGTIPGLYAVQKCPQLFSAYIGVSQVINGIESDRLSLDFVRRRAAETNNNEATAALQNVQIPMRDRDLREQRKWLMHYRGLLRKPPPPSRGESLFGRMEGIFTCSAYSWRDLVAIGRYGRSVEQQLMTQVRRVDFPNQVIRVDVPVYFFEGRHDWTAPSGLIPAYMEKMSAPVKEIVWFEESAHVPLAEEREKFAAEVRRVAGQNRGLPVSRQPSSEWIRK